MHEGYGTQKEAEALLQMSFRLAVWFMEVYDDWDFKEPPKYKELTPWQKLTLRNLIATYEEKVKELEEQLKRLRQEQLYVLDDEKSKRKKESQAFGSRINLTEEETRFIIDEQLRDAGWEADTEGLRYGKGVPICLCVVECKVTEKQSK